ncbi:MAG: response regulator transcription factor [Acidobacteriota bacterium]|nr:response regulator transcription factor [Acidobacteriota bacterium]
MLPSIPTNARGAWQKRPLLFLLPLEPSAAAGAHLSSLRRSFPRAKLLLVGSRLSGGQLLSLLRQGAHGYLPVDKLEAHLTAAVHDVWGGHIWICADDLSTKKENAFSRSGEGARDGILLTPQQARIAELVKRGLTNKEIAPEIGISERTVKFHLRNIFLKLGIDSRHKISEALLAPTGPKKGSGTADPPRQPVGFVP